MSVVRNFRVLVCANLVSRYGIGSPVLGLMQMIPFTELIPLASNTYVASLRRGTQENSHASSHGGRQVGLLSWRTIRSLAGQGACQKRKNHDLSSYALIRKYLKHSLCLTVSDTKEILKQQARSRLTRSGRADPATGAIKEPPTRIEAPPPLHRALYVQELRNLRKLLRVLALGHMCERFEGHREWLKGAEFEEARKAVRYAYGMY